MPFLSSLTHPWVALITGLLTINPQDRMTLADAFQHPWALTYVRQCATRGHLGVYLLFTDKANWLPKVLWPWRRNLPSLSVIQAISTLWILISNRMLSRPARHVVCASQSECHRESPIPRDDDEIMLSATRGSQFTQSLMLFVRPSYTLRNRPQLFFLTMP